MHGFQLEALYISIKKKTFLHFCNPFIFLMIQRKKVEIKEKKKKLDKCYERESIMNKNSNEKKDNFE